MKKSLLARWRSSFFTGLAVVLPVVISVGILVWLFGTVANFTDKLLFFLPRELTHADDGKGGLLWHWSLFAFVFAVVVVTLTGQLARIYIGRRLIAYADQLLLHVPLLNKIYGTIKQVNEAFGSGSKSSFKQVVLVEFPRDGVWSLGFITGEQNQEVQAKTKEKVVAIFVPTTPNPTSGYLILVPEDKVTKLDMSVADGIKFVISLGAVSPEYSGSLPPAPRLLP
ncbi:MAG: DUF502 domain-containing protein [Verrucomicrobia bacterium]|nr:DUF502 domain-containing protein [Verrucomicrobiota bacterium]